MKKTWDCFLRGSGPIKVTLKPHKGAKGGPNAPPWYPCPPKNKPKPPKSTTIPKPITCDSDYLYLSNTSDTGIIH